MSCHFHPEQRSWRICKTCTREICNECVSFDTEMAPLCPLCWKSEVKSRRMRAVGMLFFYLGLGIIAFIAVEKFMWNFVTGVQYLTTPLWMKMWFAYCLVTIFLGWPHVERFPIVHWLKPCPNFIPRSATINKAFQASLLGVFFGPYTIGKTIYDIFTAGRRVTTFSSN